MNASTTNAGLSVLATAPEATDDELYEAVRRRDPAYDGRIFYGVRTTGVYCRPSCAARLAKRENISFQRTADVAEDAGFRACKRCAPDRVGYGSATRLTRGIKDESYRLHSKSTHYR